MQKITDLSYINICPILVFFLKIKHFCIFTNRVSITSVQSAPLSKVSRFATFLLSQIVKDHIFSVSFMTHPSQFSGWKFNAFLCYMESVLALSGGPHIQH